MTLKWIKSKHTMDICTKLNTYALLSGEKVDKVVICMHGYGDNAKNIANMAHSFHLEHVLFLFIEGTMPVRMSFGGFQWFDLFHDPYKDVEKATAMVNELFTHIVEEHKISSEKIYFMGFSQGAGMALYCGLQLQKKIGGIISLSGFLLNTGQLLKSQEFLYKECPILLMHGDQDQTIFPILYFEAQGILEFMGFKNVTTKMYQMGHTVCPEQLDEIKKFLTDKDPA